MKLSLIIVILPLLLTMNIYFLAHGAKHTYFSQQLYWVGTAVIFRWYTGKLRLRVGKITRPVVESQGSNPKTISMITAFLLLTHHDFSYEEVKVHPSLKKNIIISKAPSQAGSTGLNSLGTGWWAYSSVPSMPELGLSQMRCSINIHLFTWKVCGISESLWYLV